MKKIIPVLCLAVLFTTCRGMQISQKPEARIKDFDIKSISLQDVTLLFDIEISNPYPVGLKLDNIDLTFFVENKQFMKTGTEKGLRIEAQGKKSSIFTVNLKYTDIMKIVKDYASKDYLDCLADVAITIPLPEIPGLQKNISFNYKLKKKIPAIKPSIAISGFSVQMPSRDDIVRALKKSGRSLKDTAKIYKMINAILSGKDPGSIVDLASLDLKLKVNFDIVMKNSTKATLAFQDLNYDFLVNGGKLVDGVTRDIKHNGSVSTLSVSNEFSTKALGKPILNAFRSRKGTFHLKGTAMIKLPDSVKKAPLPLKFDEEGRFNL